MGRLCILILVRVALIWSSFVGLTPGVLVCWGVAHWLSGVIGGRQGRKIGRNHGDAIRSLRYTFFHPFLIRFYLILTLSEKKH